MDKFIVLNDKHIRISSIIAYRGQIDHTDQNIRNSFHDGFNEYDNGVAYSIKIICSCGAEFVVWFETKEELLKNLDILNKLVEQ